MEGFGVDANTSSIGSSKYFDPFLLGPFCLLWEAGGGVLRRLDEFNELVDEARLAATAGFD